MTGVVTGNLWLSGMYSITKLLLPTGGTYPSLLRHLESSCSECQ